MGWRQEPFETDTAELGERAAVALEDENQPDPARRWLAIREAGVHAELASRGLYFTMMRNIPGAGNAVEAVPAGGERGAAGVGVGGVAGRDPRAAAAAGA